MTWREISEQRLALIDLVLDAEELLIAMGRDKAASNVKTRLMTITKTSEPENIVADRRTE